MPPGTAQDFVAWTVIWGDGDHTAPPARPSFGHGFDDRETGMALTLWFRCPVAGCPYKKAIRLEPGEADQSGFAKREAALRDEHPNHPTTSTTDRKAQEVTGSA
jgi:hypothetical protein